MKNLYRRLGQLVIMVLLTATSVASEPIELRIDHVSNVELSGTVQVEIRIANIDTPIPELGGFDLLVQYDASLLSLTGAMPGSLIINCDWEYFTYRNGPTGNCGPSACPSGIVRIVAIGEYNNGPNHPSCFMDTTGHLATIEFMVTANPAVRCTETPLRFIWYDCGDNAFSSVSGDSLFISRHVYDFDNPTPIEADVAFPSFFGANSSCDVDLGDGAMDRIRMADFYSGGISFECPQLGTAPIQVEIEQVSDVNQGGHQQIKVTIANPLEALPEIGGYDFLIQYPYNALTFVRAIEATHFQNCDWEYFTYRYNSTNCLDTSSLMITIRIVAIAETNNGPYQPSCSMDSTGHLFTLDFLVSDNRELEGDSVAVEFLWCDCGDNTISGKTGDSLFISRSVYSSFYHVDISDSNSVYPSLFGAQNSDCMSTPDRQVVRQIDFHNGGMYIQFAGNFDGTGDVNYNEIPYEIADLVMFRDRLVFGDSVFTSNPSGQEAFTDINRNCIPLEIADFVFMVRIITGDFQPNPDSVLHWPSEVLFYQDKPSNSVRVTTDVELGAVLLLFDGEITDVTTPTMASITHHFNGDSTTVLLYSVNDSSIGVGIILEYTAVGDPILAVVETATREAHLVTSSIDGVTSAPVVESIPPSHFTLHQNYPNPFNPITTISFDVTRASRYQIEIYNALGQKIDLFSGNATPGYHSVEWDASDYSSGIYFYKLNVDNFEQSRKMLLLK